MLIRDHVPYRGRGGKPWACSEEVTTQSLRSSGGRQDETGRQYGPILGLWATVLAFRASSDGPLGYSNYSPMHGDRGRRSGELEMEPSPAAASASRRGGEAGTGGVMEPKQAVAADRLSNLVAKTFQ
jgi:hypothetical protein